MAQDKKIVVQREAQDTLQEKIIRHVFVGVGVTIVSFAVDYWLYQRKVERK